MRGLLLLALSTCLLVSCDKPISESQAYDIADDVSDARFQQLESRISDLESELETERDLNRKQTEFISAVNDRIDVERNDRLQEVSELRDHYNDHLSRAHGATR